MLYSHLRDSLLFFKSHFVYIALIVLPFLIPIGLLEYVYTEFIMTDKENMVQIMLPVVIGLLIHPIYQTALLISISSSLKQQYPALTDLWKRGLTLWLPVVAANFLYGAAVATGMILLVIPGIYFAIRFSFVELLVVLENRDPFNAFQESWERTKGQFLSIFGGYALISIVLFFPIIKFSTYSVEHNQNYLLTTFLPSIILGVLGTFYTIYIFRIYHHVNDKNKADSQI